MKSRRRLGRPTTDPKERLIAVRLSARHVRQLEQRAERDGVGVSEALRRILDEHSGTDRAVTSRRPSPDEQQSFDAAFAALGLTPRRRRGRKRR